VKLLENFRSDIPAGIVVFFVAIPLCLGIALASGAPLFSGLIAGIVGGIVVGSLSGSALGVSGPAAGLTVIVLGAIEDLGSFEAFLLAVVLAGVLQIVFGLLRAGTFAYFFPSAVIKGMLAGIGLLIILKQIPYAIGWDSRHELDYFFQSPGGETTLSRLLHALEHLDPSALVVSTGALTILILWETVLAGRARIFRLIQGPLVAVAFGIAYQVLASRLAPAWALDASSLVQVPVAESFSEVVGFLRFPDWSQIGTPAIYTAAFTLAIVASIETLLCVEATDKLDPHRRVTPTNRELLAQGTGNIVSGLIGGLPVTQVIVRSSANIQAGGASKSSAIFHGLLLLVFTLGFPALLNRIPLAALASVLFVVGYKLAKPALFADMARRGPSQLAPFLVTIGGILLTDLLTGVLIGLLVAMSIILYRSYTSSHSIEFETRDDPDGRHLVRVRLGEHVPFLSRGSLLRQLSEIPDGSRVILDLSGSIFVDHDVIEILRDFEESASRRDLVLEWQGSPDRGAQLSDAA
jgi:MFS superfamily sulfate permease-like transporter